jgi:hypothetical protein
VDDQVRGKVFSQTLVINKSKGYNSMKKPSPGQWLILLILLTICTTAAYGQRRRGGVAASPSARLSEMKILPYNGGSDTFGENMAEGDHSLFNDLDTSLLVKVEVSGKAGEYSDRNVEITVRQGNKVLLSRNAMVGIYNESGKYYVTAWINNPICQDITIQARLLGQRQPSVINKKITANCGE